MNFKIIPVYVALLCSLAPIQSASDNKNGFLSVFAGFQPKASFTNLIGSCNLVKQQAADWYSGLSTPKKCVLGFGASALVASGLYGGYKWWNRGIRNNQGEPQVSPIETIVEQHSARGNCNNFVAALEDLAVQQNKTREVMLHETFEHLNGMMYAGQSRMHSTFYLISAGVNPFAFDSTGMPLLVKLVHDIDPEFVLCCLQAKSLNDPSLAALSLNDVKAGIKETVRKLLSVEGFSNEFNTIVDFVSATPQADVFLTEDNRVFAQNIRFTPEDWREVLYTAATDVEDVHKWRRLADLASQTHVSNHIARFVPVAHVSNIVTYYAALKGL